MCACVHVGFGCCGLLRKRSYCDVLFTVSLTYKYNRILQRTVTLDKQHCWTPNVVHTCGTWPSHDDSCCMRIASTSAASAVVGLCSSSLSLSSSSASSTYASRSSSSTPVASLSSPGSTVSHTTRRGGSEHAHGSPSANPGGGTQSRQTPHLSH